MSTPYPIPRAGRQTDVLQGDGESVYGPFTFRIFDTDDVVVYTRPTGQASFSPVAVTVEKVNGDPFDFFTIEFASALPSTTSFVVSSQRVPERSAGVNAGTLLSMQALEKELSKIAAVQQELRRDINRCLKSEFGEETQALPSPAEDRLLGWKDDRLVNLDAAEFMQLLLQPQQITHLFSLLFQALPTELPDEPNVPWNNGGMLSFS